jgi:hypothetical protein
MVGDRHGALAARRAGGPGRRDPRKPRKQHSAHPQPALPSCSFGRGGEECPRLAPVGDTALMASADVELVRRMHEALACGGDCARRDRHSHQFGGWGADAERGPYTAAPAAPLALFQGRRPSYHALTRRPQSCTTSPRRPRSLSRSPGSPPDPRDQLEPPRHLAGSHHSHAVLLSAPCREVGVSRDARGTPRTGVRD